MNCLLVTCSEIIFLIVYSLRNCKYNIKHMNIHKIYIYSYVYIFIFFCAENYFMCISILLVCTYVCHMCAWLTKKFTRRCQNIWNWNYDGCEPLHGQSELKPYPLQEQVFNHWSPVPLFIHFLNNSVRCWWYMLGTPALRSLNQSRLQSEPLS